MQEAYLESPQHYTCDEEAAGSAGSIPVQHPNICSGSATAGRVATILGAMLRLHRCM